MAELCFVTTCKGRLASLKQALPTIAAQPGCDCVVVDYSCPDECGAWVEANFPQVKVVRVPGRAHFNPSYARNASLPAINSPWICFCDSDVLVNPTFSTTMTPML